MITDAIKKNYYNEFEADKMKEEGNIVICLCVCDLLMIDWWAEKKKKEEEEEKKSDEDKSDIKESDESDSYVMEEEENQNNSDDSDGLNIGKRDPKKNTVD